VALSTAAAESLAADMIEHHRGLLDRNGRIGKIDRYLKGDHDLPYMPRGAKQEYKHIATRSITNWLPLISDTFAKGLFVDGYRPANEVDNAAPWTYWQANGLDARQTIIHRGALEFGTSYVLVLPGDPSPLIRPLSPTRTHALYLDHDDEWPQFVVVHAGMDSSGGKLYRLYDNNAAYTLVVAKDATKPKLVLTEEHNLGVTPVVRFRDRLDDYSRGIISPLINIQDRVNESVFSLMIALQYASFRQRWATGLAIPLDDQNQPVEPFKAAVDRLWVTDSPDARFGDFDQTEVGGHLDTYSSTVRSLAAIAQTPPHVLLGDLVNLSADALAAAEASTQRKIGEYETIFGESWEQTLRLAAAADGDDAGAQDMQAEVRWRDTEARSLAQTVDALGKMVQMLSVPAEAAWERIPGVTDQDVARWKTLRTQGDVFGALLGDIQRQSMVQPTPAQEPAAESRGDGGEQVVDAYDGVTTGDVVTLRDGRTGRVEHIMTGGTLGVPGSRFAIPATPTDPAVIIRLYTNGVETENTINIRFSEIDLG